MKQYEDKLKKFMQGNNVHAEHLSFTMSCHTVEDAAKAANVNAEDLVKSICMIGPDGNLIVAIVKGRVEIRALLINDKNVELKQIN
ncbi:MAG: hypothetical protein HGA85_05960, partial [Nanoarchaeota archaeon]|nr:hypothetical protein [Nanoarchaeota archaeon]